MVVKFPSKVFFVAVSRTENIHLLCGPDSFLGLKPRKVRRVYTQGGADSRRLSITRVIEKLFIFFL